MAQFWKIATFSKWLANI